MWDDQEYQAWTTGQIGPSLSALMLSVSCEASCKIMDFLRYGLREGLIPWFFLMSWQHNPFTQHFNRQEVMRSSSWKNAFEYLTWNVFKKCAQEFLKTHPFGFFKLIVLFCGLLPTWPGFVQLQFITQFSQHPRGRGDYCSREKDKNTHSRPTERMGDRISFRISIPWLPTLCSLLVYIMQNISVSLLTSPYFY